MAKIEFYSYHRWNYFGFNFIPSLYFMRDKNEPRENLIGIAWLCFSIEIEW